MSMASIFDLLRLITTTTMFHDIRLEKGYVYETKTRLASQSAAFNIYVKVGDKPLHALSAISAGLKVTIDLIEGVTVASGSEGTAVALRNLNRSYSDNGLLTKVYLGSTYSGGTVIAQLQSGFGTNPGQASSGSYGETFKRILKQNTGYVYLITPSASTDITLDAVMMERYLE